MFLLRDTLSTAVDVSLVKIIIYKFTAGHIYNTVKDMNIAALAREDAQSPNKLTHAH